MSLLKTLMSLNMEARQFTGNSYPDFIVATRPRSPGVDCVPVFMLHSAIAAPFEAQLRHLARNGYQTIDCDTMLSFLRGDTVLSAPSVMLTFDDGERSLYRVAYPLLRKYGMKAVNFIVPGMVVEDPASRPAAGKHWVSWSEVREMHDAGVIDFQSHTMWHERMFVGDQPVDFWRPELFSDGLMVDRPRVRRNTRDILLGEFGAPVYDMAPRMLDRPKFHDREDVCEACIAHVSRNGGEDFFRRKDWKMELLQVWKQACNGRPAGVFETESEQASAILDSLCASRAVLEEKLQREVRHLAYPWALGGELAAQLSRQAGYYSNFHGPIDGIPHNRPGGDPYRIARIKDDYIERLPGKGRRPLWSILAMKTVRRIRSRDIY